MLAAAYAVQYYAPVLNESRTTSVTPNPGQLGVPGDVARTKHLCAISFGRWIYYELCERPIQTRVSYLGSRLDSNANANAQYSEFSVFSNELETAPSPGLVAIVLHGLRPR